MEGDDCNFPPDLSDNHSQRGSVASSATLSRAQDVLVYLFGDSAVHLSMEGLGSVSVQELGHSVREALQIPESVQDVLAFWLCSPLLELQLKTRHQPYKLCRQWQDLLYRFTDASEEDISQDEPFLQYRRNVFYPKAKELQIEDEGVLRLLYEEARSNIILDRYPCDPEHWTALGALSLALEAGTGRDNQQVTATLREKKLSFFLPAHVVMGSGGFLSTLRGKSSRHAELEQKLLEEYRKISTSAGDAPESRQLLHQYLNMCHMLPFYGCAFFLGEIDKPAQGILQRGKRKAVNVGICLEGVYVMDVKEKHVLLGLRFSELSWDHSYPEEEGDSHILWLEFDGEEDGTPVNKLLKIYSKQAELMSGFIEFCVELRSASEGGAAADANSEAGLSHQPAEREAGAKNGRGGRRGMLQRQGSVVCSRVNSLNTIDYVDNGKEIKRLKPKRAASFFARQATAPSYSAVQRLKAALSHQGPGAQDGAGGGSGSIPAVPQRQEQSQQPSQNSDAPSPAQPQVSPAQPTGGRRRRASEMDPDERRQRFLERNRAAASRCRQKRKLWVNSLEKKADDLANMNVSLTNEVTLLRNEVAQLKQLLLAHKDCPVTVMQKKAAFLAAGGDKASREVSAEPIGSPAAVIQHGPSPPASAPSPGATINGLSVRAAEAVAMSVLAGMGSGGVVMATQSQPAPR